MSDDKKVLDKPTEPGTEPQAQPAQEPGTEPNPAIEAENAALKKLSADELIDIIRETRSEAKNRRLKTRELEEQIAENERKKKLEEEALLEKNNEFETLYSKLKEQTADYEELKEFKTGYLETCKQEVEELQKGLTKAESEVFELSAKNMTYNEQLTLIKKMLGNRQTTAIIDRTQSQGRTQDDPPPPNGGPKMPFSTTGGPLGKVTELLQKGRTQK